MRFLFTAACYKPATRSGGLIAALANLAEELVRQGHDVCVTASNRDLNETLSVPCFQETEINGVQVCYFPVSPFWWQNLPWARLRRMDVFRFHPEFRRWVRKHADRWDVVDTQLGFLSSTPFCSRLARRLGKIHLYRQQGNLDPRRLGRNAFFKRLYIQWVEKSCLRRADACIALSEREAEVYRQWVPESKIACIPNGVSMAEWTTPAQPSAELAAILSQMGADARVFAWMGRFSKLKGPDLFVEAFVQMAKRSPHAHAILAGPDQEHLQKACRLFAETHGCAGRVHVLDHLAGRDRAALLQRADVFVLPTGGEGFSMAILEAMACRCAILTTPEANFQELEKHGAGAICSRMTEEWTTALEMLAEMPAEDLRQMQAQAFELVQARYDIVNIAGQYARLCESLQNRLRAQPTA